MYEQRKQPGCTEMDESRTGSATNIKGDKKNIYKKKEPRPQARSRSIPSASVHLEEVQ